MPSEDVEEIRKKRKRKKKKEQTLSTSWVISSLNPCITVANLSILGPLWKSTTLCADCWLVCLAVGVDLLLRVLVTTGDPRHSTPTTWLHSYIKWDELVVRSSPCFQVQPFASVAEGLTTILAYSLAGFSSQISHTTLFGSAWLLFEGEDKAVETSTAETKWWMGREEMAALEVGLSSSTSKTARHIGHLKGALPVNLSV